jgi:F0F1-type ATP synthase assembly protein I
MTTNEIPNKSQQFDEKINNIEKQFFSALDDFKKYYVYYNKNPEVNEFQNYYVNSKGQLQSMSKDLFITTNDINKNIEILDNQMKEVSIKLNKEKKIYDESMKLLGNLQNTKNGSEVLINDSKEEYNKQYYYNVELICGILIVGLILGTFFKSKVIKTK